MMFGSRQPPYSEVQLQMAAHANEAVQAPATNNNNQSTNNPLALDPELFFSNNPSLSAFLAGNDIPQTLAIFGPETHQNDSRALRDSQGDGHLPITTPEKGSWPVDITSRSRDYTLGVPAIGISTEDTTGGTPFDFLQGPKETSFQETGDTLEKTSHLLFPPSANGFEQVGAGRDAQSGLSSDHGQPTGSSRNVNLNNTPPKSRGLGGLGGGSSGGIGGGKQPYNHPSPGSVRSTNDGKPREKCACWYWLYDPIRYQGCLDISKEPHHLKNTHLKEHFDDGKLPPELQNRMSYSDVWTHLFPGHPIPTITDRNQKVIEMAKVFLSVQNGTHEAPPTPMPSTTTTTHPRRGIPTPNGKHIVRSSDQSELPRPSTRGSFLDQQPSFSARSTRATLGNYPAKVFTPSSVPSGSTHVPTISVASSVANSWVLTGLTDPQSLEVPPLIKELEEECSMLPDNDGIDPIDSMDLDSRKMELIDGMMKDDDQPFIPLKPKIRVFDVEDKSYYRGGSYYWHDEHAEVPFDFSTHYLVYFGPRSTGASGSISIESFEVLQKEYFHNLKSKAQGEGYVSLTKAPKTNFLRLAAGLLEHPTNKRIRTGLS